MSPPLSLALFSFNFLSFYCRDHFFLFSFHPLRGPATVCLHLVKRFNSCIFETVVFVHCAITFRATSLLVCPFLCTSGRKPRVFYTMSVYNLAAIRRRRSQQGIYNDDAGHISWPFVHECLVRRAYSTWDWREGLLSDGPDAFGMEPRGTSGNCGY